MASADRPDVPDEWIERIDGIVAGLPSVSREYAWVGVRWRIRTATFAHVFGGEDQLFRIMFRADPDEVHAFANMGHPYFQAEWGGNMVGIYLDASTDWQELAELLTDSYCIQAPAKLAEQVQRPDIG